MKKIAAVASLLVASGLGWWLVPAVRAPTDSVVESWVKGRGISTEIKLYASGRYVSTTHCDVCTPEATVGTWRKSASSIVLTPSHGEPVVLRRASFRGCRAMVTQGAPAPRFPAEVFFPASESCGNAL